MLCCPDDNECESFNGGCEHYCTNLNGTHQCSCRVGYTLEGQHHCTRKSAMMHVCCHFPSTGCLSSPCASSRSL